MLERLFRLEERGTTARVEVLGGVTTFVSMAYIAVVNPAILKHAGIPSGPSTVATILAAAFGSLLMGLFANRPIAVAPYMGENAFIAFGLASLGIGWQMRLGAVFVSGAVFLAITLLGVRGWLANSISSSLKHAFAVGIGLFLAFVGLGEAGLVAPGGEVPVKLGDLHDPRALLAAAGFALLAILLVRRIRGAIFLSIAATALAGLVLGLGEKPSAITELPFTGEYSLAPIAFQLDIGGILRAEHLPVLLTLFLMSFLDTLGTLAGLGAAGGLLDEQGNFPDIRRPMLVDAVACMASALLGTSTSGAYIESAAGIRDGARTGLAAVVTASLFGLSLFFVPLLEPLQHLGYAYGPALVAVGIMMTSSVRRIELEDMTELIPAFIAITLMVFTYNIGNGLTAGLLLHPVLKLAAGRWREVRGGGLVLAALSAVYYAYGLPH